tara:strand:+ start:348 stop:458 length:111 start_codon:yes stop_codon:yes gene_type:complete
MILAPELYVGWIVSVTFVGLFIVVAFIADVIERKNK